MVKFLKKGILLLLPIIYIACEPPPITLYIINNKQKEKTYEIRDKKERYIIEFSGSCSPLYNFVFPINGYPRLSGGIAFKIENLSKEKITFNTKKIKINLRCGKIIKYRLSHYVRREYKFPEILIKPEEYLKLKEPIMEVPSDEIYVFGIGFQFYDPSIKPAPEKTINKNEVITLIIEDIKIGDEPIKLEPIRFVPEKGAEPLLKPTKGAVIRNCKVIPDEISLSTNINVKIYFEVLEDVAVDLEIWEASALKVYSQIIEAKKGMNIFIWNLRDTKNRRIDNGIYLIRIVAKRDNERKYIYPPYIRKLLVKK